MGVPTKKCIGSGIESIEGCVNDEMEKLATELKVKKFINVQNRQERRKQRLIK